MSDAVSGVSSAGYLSRAYSAVKSGASKAAKYIEEKTGIDLSPEQTYEAAFGCAGSGGSPVTVGNISPIVIEKTSVDKALAQQQQDEVLAEGEAPISTIEVTEGVNSVDLQGPIVFNSGNPVSKDATVVYSNLAPLNISISLPNPVTGGSIRLFTVEPDSTQAGVISASTGGQLNLYGTSRNSGGIVDEDVNGDCPSDSHSYQSVSGTNTCFAPWDVDQTLPENDRVWFFVPPSGVSNPKTEAANGINLYTFASQADIPSSIDEDLLFAVTPATSNAFPADNYTATVGVQSVITPQ